jgi:5-formyltetrahydrofolate cyclo-ligase
MNMDEKIKRINELYHKSQKEGITDAEKEEQAELRRAYIDSVRGNLQGQLDSIRVKMPDGSLQKLQKKK